MTNSSTPARGVLTDLLIDYLRTELTGSTILVGDGIAPKDGGWTEGEPGKGEFVPYVVLATGPGAKQSRDAVATENKSWLMTYTLRAVGGARNQTDWAADTARAAMVEYRPKHVDLNGDWKVAQTTFPRLGPLVRIDTTDPAYWEQVDDMSVWLEAHLP